MASLTNLMLEGSLRFNGHNYNHWKQRMLTIFEYRRLDELVLGTKTHPTSDQAEQDKFDDRNREAVMLLKLSIIDDQLLQIPSGKPAVEIWKYLKELHETFDKNRAFFLKNQLFSIMMDERMSLQEHLTKIKDIRDQLKAIGRKKEEEDIVVITLKCLPSSYEHFIETLNITSTNVDLKFLELCTKLMKQDHWKQQFGSSASTASSEQAFAAKSFQQNINNHQSSQPFQHQPSAQSLDGSTKQNVQCNYCHKFGHMKFECWKRLAAQARQNASQPTAQVVELPDQGEAAFFAF